MFSVVILTITLFSFFVRGNVDVSKIVGNYLKSSNVRFSTFCTALNLAKDRNAKLFIETGTCRTTAPSQTRCVGDGCSTYIFSQFKMALNDSETRLYSVDISEQSCKIARRNLEQFNGKGGQIIQSDSVKFLQEWPAEDKIDFLYLDSFDFNHGKELLSQQHHLKELMAVYDEKIHEKTIIFMDDCGLRMGGKCKLVREFLLKNNWKIVEDKYQTIFIRAE
jgi:hypothetical protein